MERAKTILLVAILVLLALVGLRLESRLRSLGSQLDAIHLELRNVNGNLDELQQAQRPGLRRPTMKRLDPGYQDRELRLPVLENGDVAPCGSDLIASCY